MTEASRYLTALARQVAAAYVAQTNPRAILLTGSAAEGVSDYFSDLDLIVYYEKLPSPDQLAAARAAVQATDFGGLSGSETESFVEEYVLQGVECQVAHLTVAAWERDMRAVLEDCEPATLVEKAIMGLLAGVALHGSDLIEQWQAQAASYPEGLAQATVEHYLRFFPLWLAAEWWRERDATIFYHQMLVEASVNLLAVLAGLNGVYYSSFQFKRLHRFAGTLRLVPERFAERLDGLYALDPVAGGVAMERLVEETVTLVEAHMPAVDTAPARKHLGKRHHPWVATAGTANTE
jgi:hypothetical protein